MVKNLSKTDVIAIVSVSVIILLIIAIVLVFLFGYNAMLKPIREEYNQLLKISESKDTQIIFIKTGQRLTGEKAVRFLQELKSKEVTPHHGAPDDQKITFQIVQDDEVYYTYTIQPDYKFKDEYWIFSEKDDYFRINRLAIIKSKWLTRFFEDEDLY